MSETNSVKKNNILGYLLLFIGIFYIVIAISLFNGLSTLDMILSVGNNASNQNITDVDYIYANYFIGDGSLLIDVNYTETDPLWNLEKENYYNKTEIDSFSLSQFIDDLGNRGYTSLSNFTNDVGFITQYNVTENDITQYQSSITITESQISDLQDYLTTESNGDLIISGNLFTNGKPNIKGKDLLFRRGSSTEANTVLFDFDTTNFLYHATQRFNVQITTNASRQGNFASLFSGSVESVNNLAFEQPHETATILINFSVQENAFLEPGMASNNRGLVYAQGELYVFGYSSRGLNGGRFRGYYGNTGSEQYSNWVEFKPSREGDFRNSRYMTGTVGGWSYLRHLEIEIYPKDDSQSALSIAEIQYHLTRPSSTYTSIVSKYANERLYKSLSFWDNHNSKTFEISANGNLFVGGSSSFEGNLGVGTGNPLRPLHVVMGNTEGTPSMGSQVGIFQNNPSSTSNSIFAIISGHTGTGAQSIAGLQFGDKDSINRGQIYYYNYADALTFGTNGNERMRISSTGNVGIGTDSPNQKLHVIGNINASGTVYASAFVSHSPIRLGEDADVGHTRLCYKATNGDVVLQEIQLIGSEYKDVYTKDTQGICDKAIIKQSTSNEDIQLVDGTPTRVQKETRTYETLYTKQQSTEIIQHIRDTLEEYHINTSYTQGDIFQYNGEAYEVIQSHTSQEDWMPNTVSSLYKKLILHQYNEVTEWTQPQGSHDCYPTGAIVTFNSKTYESQHSCNVWQPPTLWKLI